MRTPTTAAIAATLLLALTACTSADEDAEQPDPAVDEAAAEQDNTDQDQTSEDDTIVLDLEETHTYDDGLSIHLGDFERFNEADLGYPDGADWVTFTVTFTNGTDTPVEIDRIMRNCQVDGVVGDYEAFDHLQYDWPSMIQPGDTGTWQPACEMAPDATELQWDMAVFTTADESEPSYPTVYWTGMVD